MKWNGDPFHWLVVFRHPFHWPNMIRYPVYWFTKKRSFTNHIVTMFMCRTIILLTYIDHFRIASIRLGWAHSQRVTKSGRKHYNPPPLTVMWMNFDSPNFPSFCSLSAIILFQTCSNKCNIYVLSFHKCIKIKYKMVNMYGVFRD